MEGPAGDRWKATRGQAGRRRAPGSQSSLPPLRPGNQARRHPPTCPPGPHRLLGAPRGWSCTCPPMWQPALPGPGGPTSCGEGTLGKEGGQAEVLRGAGADPACPVPS